MILQASRAPISLQAELVELPNTSRSHPKGFLTPPGTIDRNFRACREASRHRQARQIVTCEPPRHRLGRGILILQAPRAPKSLQDPPTGACGAPEHVKKPSDSLHGAYVKRPESPKTSQRNSKDVPDTDRHDRSRLVSLPNTKKADES